MSLSSAKAALKAAIILSWGHTGASQIPSLAASDFASAAQTFAQAGVPMTVDSGTQASGQAVAGFATAAPGSVSGTGTGGLDTSTTGSGLSGAKAQLITDLTAVYANTANTATTAADGVATAVLAFLSKAKVMTSVSGTVAAGQAVPAPSGPVAPGPWTGSGTGGLESTSGGGLSGAITALTSALTTTWAKNSSAQTPATVSTDIANALYAFYTQAHVATTDSGTSGGGAASVSIPSGSGSTTGSSTAAGTGSGALT